MEELEGYHEQLQRDTQFLCADKRMDTELVDRLVLQLNRIYPQILNDKEARKFRDLSVATEERLAELLKHLRRKGDQACHEFYSGLHIHAEDVYRALPSRVKRREMTESKKTAPVPICPKKYVLNDKGPMFFLSCCSVAVGLAMIYYYGEEKTLKGTGPLLYCSAAGLGCGAKEVYILH